MDEMKSSIVEITGEVDHGRRNAMRKIAISAGVLAGISVLPERWTQPIIGQIVMPAHAATSGATLRDPCQVQLVQGDTASAAVVVKVTGFVTPPTANLPVLITATAVGGANAQVTAQTTTNADGTYEALITLFGGPGITVVNVTSTVTGAEGVARCSAYPPTPQQTTTTPIPTTIPPSTPPPPPSTPPPGL